MPLVRRLAVLLLACALVACGDDDAAGPRPTATVPAATATASAPPTATASAPPTATLAPTLTATAPPAPATATRTAPPSETPTATATATPAVGAVALFSADPASPDNPFPSDRLLDDSGHVVLAAARLEAVVPADPRFDATRAYLASTAAQFSALSGFSTFAPMQVVLDAPPATGALPEGAVIVMRAEAPFEAVAVSAVGLAAGSAGANVIEIQPSVPLDARASYVYVVTSTARDADGHPLRRDPDLTAALRGEVPALNGWRASLLPAIQHLRDDLDVAPESIVAIDRFTTQPTTDDLASIAGRLSAGTLVPGAPDFATQLSDLPIGIFPEGTPQFSQLVGSATSASIAAVAVGTFAAYDFRGEDGAFDPDKVSGATPPGTNQLDFYVTIPKGAPPPAGWPVTLFGHGLGQSGRDTILIANVLGSRDSMMIGISAVSHGRRGNFLDFFDFAHPFATRDNFRQSVADMLQVIAMVRGADAPPFDQADTSHLRYLGLSLGGIMGTVFMAHAPDVPIGMLSVPGGGLAGIIRSPFIGDLLQPTLAQAVGVPRGDPYFPVLLHNFINVSQWALDPGDPVNAAPFLIDPERRLPGVPAKRILVHEGIVDTIVPNETTENLARAAGLADVKASGGCQSEDGCSGIWRFVMAEYGQPASNGHLVTFVVPQALAQARAYLESDGTAIIAADP
ncbi:hypothetical protein KF840_00005 [bacterium]|nr:hypothetical protein [bacterium]